MKMAFLPVVLWLVGTAGGLLPLPAHALDLSTGEVLRYRVFWGPLNVGTAELSYVPQGVAFGKTGGYVLQAHVKSDSMLMDLDDLWRSVGQHTVKTFTPQRYEVVQRENSYSADKLMLFSNKTITYANHRDASDKEPPLKWNGQARDPLSTVYNWRLSGEDMLKADVSTSVIGLKRPFSLHKAPAVSTTLPIRGKNVPVWKVELQAVASRKNKEPTTSSWTVWLKTDPALTPIQIVGRTKFGTFRAQLEH